MVDKKMDITGAKDSVAALVGFVSTCDGMQLKSRLKVLKALQALREELVKYGQVEKQSQISGL